MKTLIAVCFSFLTLAAAAAGDVTGTWQMSVDSPHGKAAMTLTIKQEGKHVTGQLLTPHGDERPVKGDLTDSRLTLATDDDQPEMTLTARVADTGSLSGQLSSAMGDMSWTATRTKAK